jgi:ribosome maturation factor RimP
MAKMNKHQIEPLVEDLVSNIIKDSNLELVDVEFVKERDWFLRVYLDKEGGIDVEDCRWVSEALENKLDELDPIEQAYYLEVSSPGLDRHLKKPKDFVRHAGDMVELNTFIPFDGKKEFVGELVGLENGIVTIKIGDQSMHIPQDKISMIRLHISF